MASGLSRMDSNTDRGIKTATFLRVSPSASFLVPTIFGQVAGWDLGPDPYEYRRFQRSEPRLGTPCLQTGSNFECLGTPTKQKTSTNFSCALRASVTLS
jgi:hypothetical protein